MTKKKPTTRKRRLKPLKITDDRTPTNNKVSHAAAIRFLGRIVQGSRDVSEADKHTLRDYIKRLKD